MNLMLRLLVLVISIFVASYLIPGVTIESITALIVVSIVFGIINTFVKPVLAILTFPLTVLTLGIFLIILNGLLVLLVSSIVPGFHVDSFISAILFSLVVSLVSWFLSKLS